MDSPVPGDRSIGKIARALVVLALAGLLIFYHSYTLLDLYVFERNGNHSVFEYIQSALRVAITLSLLAVVSRIRGALWAMWLSIGTLVATQLWAHLTGYPVDFTAGRHPLSYLKGFIFPTIITLAWIYPSKRHTRGFPA